MWIAFRYDEASAPLPTPPWHKPAGTARTPPILPASSSGAILWVWKARANLLHCEVRFGGRFREVAEPSRRRNSQARFQALVVEIGTSLEQRQRQFTSGKMPPVAVTAAAAVITGGG